MVKIKDNPLRYPLSNELHARPFPIVEVPSKVAILAIKRPVDAASRDRSTDQAHLQALLDRYGATRLPEGGTHYFGQIGKHFLKWESHTEFVTYMIFGSGQADTPFDGSTFGMFPEDWLAEMPGERITSALIRVEPMQDEAEIVAKLDDWLIPESLATSYVLDKSAVIAGDFRIDPQGHMRFALFVADGVGPRRVGRIVQRLVEIETYKTMSMFGLAMARDLSGRLNAIEEDLTVLVESMQDNVDSPDVKLEQLLRIAADLASQSTRSSFRFGATGAYEALVNQRVAVLREERLQGRQTFGEFMLRRFDPAMRTVKSAERRLEAMGERATRASDLLRTRVDVDRSAQNQRLLESMDRRADLQLRLQKTVEGLSVVAISYYAVSLVLYVLGPVAAGGVLSKSTLTALVTPVVIAAVFVMVRRIRKSME